MLAPSNFVSAGIVDRAYFSPSAPPFLRQRRYSGRRAQGVCYEKKVQARLLDLFPNSYMPSPWLHFQSAGRWRWCQPDGVLFDVDNARIICIEVKLNHTTDAWWQTRRLYVPVLQKCLEGQTWDFEVCEVVRWFDPAVQFPEPVELTAQVDKPSDNFKVHIWKP